VRGCVGPLMSSVTIGTVPWRPSTVTLYQVPSFPQRWEGCCLLPKMIGRIHLNTIFKGRFLIWKLDFYSRQDVPLAAQEECSQACVRA
jgi:hypothetical protein